ncbi:MAG: HAMP domain-containing sensor histidine kinase [Rubrivivax sp.]
MDHFRELAALAAHLSSRRDAIVEAWRHAVVHDPGLTTSATLPRSQLTDHIPVMLQAYERRLETDAAPEAIRAPDQDESAAAHGLHRWQQGYDLLEVSRELGCLNECVVVELEDYAEAHPGLDHQVMASARRLWAKVSSLESSSSIAEYFRLQQLEANGHIYDLQQALEALREISQKRADLLHEAAHDLRGNMSVVLTATAGLKKTEVAEVPHHNFLRILDRNVTSLQHLLDDVLNMARLQAGKDRPRVTPVNVGQLLQELCEDMQELACQRGLTLKFSGPLPFLVEGDAMKIRRITQNLVLNAIKYTREGAVEVSWADGAVDDPKRWMLSVQDTGPGLDERRSAPLTNALEEATDAARADTGERSDNSSSASQTSRRLPLEGGEGIGLSIVKRLAELLDATVEVHSESGIGTTFRVLLPRRYAAASSA